MSESLGVARGSYWDSRDIQPDGCKVGVNVADAISVALEEPSQGQSLVIYERSVLLKDLQAPYIQAMTLFGLHSDA
jgi:hypothetical protein